MYVPILHSIAVSSYTRHVSFGYLFSTFWYLSTNPELTAANATRGKKVYLHRVCIQINVPVNPLTCIPPCIMIKWF